MASSAPDHANESGKNAPDSHLIAAIRMALQHNSDPTKAPEQQAYMKSELPFYGVGAPKTRKLVHDILRTHAPADRDAWEATIRELWDAAEHREDRYAALAIARHRSARQWQDPEALGLYRDLASTGAWWDLVDEIAGHLVGPIVRHHPEEAAPIIREWATHSDMWLRRTAILSQLKAKANTNTELLNYCLTHNLEGSEYGAEFFIRKAAGWALREYSKTDPEWVASFLTTNEESLAPLARREASKYLNSTIR